MTNPYYEAHFGDSEQQQEWTPEQLARETVLSFRGKLSDPETFEYLYEIVLRAINTALAAERDEKEQYRASWLADNERAKALVDALEWVVENTTQDRVRNRIAKILNKAQNL